MPNALASETSPYLLQHKDNPVQWLPWGAEALARARAEQKPIFLSIGYSACHWCHVMEHESFENESIARMLNEHFVPVKVDREERPDLDHVYMSAVQALTGRGGWPMSVFLTPEQKPFYGGTYWPPTARRGMPGFDQVLAAVIDAWRDRREEAVAGADRLTEQITAQAAPPAGDDPSPELLAAAGRLLEQQFDPRWGGFGPAPKFPHTMDLGVLLRLWARDGRGAWLDMARHTLLRMAAGGIHDQLGGGFARYSVDAEWQVPHFEKMLYDNALLAGVLVDASLALGVAGSADAAAELASVARSTLDYLLRDMTDPSGGFYSAEDADSAPEDEPDGQREEGLFYTWKPEELRRVLGEDAADLFCRVYGVTPIGNFEGRNTLRLAKPIVDQARSLGYKPDDLDREMRRSREKLLAARSARPRPALDDKAIAAWNALAIGALAHAGAALDEPAYIAAATRGAEFLLREMRAPGGRLLRAWRAGVAKLPGYLEDHAAAACAFVTLYQATFDARWLGHAAELADLILDHFFDPQSGALHATADDHERLLFRGPDLADGATPSGGALAATALGRLGRLTGDARYADAAWRALHAATGLAQRAPLAAGQWLAAIDEALGPARELVLVGYGDDAVEAARVLRARYAPRDLLAGRIGGGETADRRPLAILDGKTAQGGQPTLYVCQQGACGAPVIGLEAIRAFARAEAR